MRPPVDHLCSVLASKLLQIKKQRDIEPKQYSVKYNNKFSFYTVDVTPSAGGCPAMSPTLSAKLSDMLLLSSCSPAGNDLASGLLRMTFILSGVGKDVGSIASGMVWDD